mmetsp:Transcript_47911/g.42988  ORF Transcript_47911/g.42988 Transcript_47911/m.42988 type:complete len:238 (+) Transcript_47911:38-751(+)
MHIVDQFGDINYRRVDMNKLSNFIKGLIKYLYGIASNGYTEKWPSSLRHFMRVCMNIIDPFMYVDLDTKQVEEYGVHDMKYFCTQFGRKVIVNGKYYTGFNSRLALIQYKLIKPNIIRKSYHVKDEQDPNVRINQVWEDISKAGWFGCEEFAKPIKIILLDAAQTDSNERCNKTRKKLVNEHNLCNLQSLNSRIKIMKNGPNPYDPDAAKLHMDTLKIFNNNKQRYFSVSVPEAKNT